MDTARKQSEPVEVDPYISVYAASKRLGIATKTILQRIMDGKLVGRVVARRSVVTRESVEQLKKEMEAERSPKKPKR